MSINCAEVSRLIADPGVKGSDDWRYRLYRQGHTESYPAFTEQQIEGFGELFRQLSYEETALRRFSPVYLQVCRTEHRIFRLGLRSLSYGMGKHYSIPADSTHRPCNFVDKLVVD